MLTKRKALEKTIEMWSWLAENPDKDKEDFFEFKNISNIPYSECYCCEFDGIWGNCRNCPIINWNYDADNNMVVVDRCTNSGSAYGIWRSAIVSTKTKQQAARRIAELAELELNKLNCQVAIITNAKSKRTGKKDIIKITKDEEIKKEEQEVEIVDNTENEINELTDRYKRLFAEFENYKKRTVKEKEGLRNMLVSDIMISILPVIDNMEKAISTGTDDKAYEDGIKMVLNQLKEVLAYNGVKEIETVGMPFDPELHEAVSHVTDDKLGKNIIKEEFRKGYIIGTKVIRHSMVIVAN